MDYSSAPAHNGQRPTIPSQSSNGRSYQTAQTGPRHDAGPAQQQPATAVQQNAILPPIDPRAFGFSEAQLLAMLSHIQAQAQSGIVPPPPFAPSFLGTNTLPILPPPPPPPILPSVAPPRNVQAISSSSPRHAQTQPQPQSSQVLAPRAALPANNRVAEIMEADREEGEAPGSQIIQATNVWPVKGGFTDVILTNWSSLRPAEATTSMYPISVMNKRDQIEGRGLCPGETALFAIIPVFLRPADQTIPVLVTQTGVRTPSSNANKVRSTDESAISKTLANLQLLLSNPGTPALDKNQVCQSEEEVRKQVKSFITALHQSNIGYPNLVQETDLSLSDAQLQLLRQLYDEAKLPSLAQIPEAATISDEKVPSQPTDAQPNQTVRGPTEAALRKTPTVPPSLDASAKVPQVTAPPPASTTVTALVGTAASKPTVSAQSGARAPVGPMKPATAGTKPAMDRQEYLARLLAARSGKSASGTKAVAQPDAPTLPRQELSPQAVPPAQQASALPEHENRVSSNGPIAPQSNLAGPLPSTALASPHVDALAIQKKKAQTELARRRMEELAAKKKLAANLAATANPLPPASTSIPADTATSLWTSSAAGATDSVSATEEPCSPPTPSVTDATTEPPTAVHSPPRSPQIPTPVTVERAPSQFGKPSFPVIPGLFIANNAPLPIMATQQTSGTPNVSATGLAVSNKGRKRPVASDFDDLGPASLLAASKRPFGQERFHQSNEALIIEASDDETVESAMDMDEEEEKSGAAATTNSMLTTISVVKATMKESTLRSSGQLTNLSLPQTPIVRPGSAVSNSAVNTPSADPEHVRRKEEEIAAMKKKIAELEQRRKAKALSASRGQTPGTPAPAAVIPLMSHKPPARLEGQAGSASALVVESTTATVANDPPEPVPARQDRQITPTATAIQERAASIDLNSPSMRTPDWRTRRRAEIESGQAALNADIASKKARFEQLKLEMERYEQMKREMEQLEADTQREEQDKAKLLEELQALDVDTAGLSHQELQAKKDEIVQQRSEDAATASLIDSQETRQSTSGVPSVAADDSAEEAAVTSGAHSDRFPEETKTHAIEASAIAQNTEDESISEGQIANSDTFDDVMDLSSEADGGEGNISTNSPPRVTQPVSKFSSAEGSYSPDDRAISVAQFESVDEEMADEGDPVPLTSEPEEGMAAQQPTTGESSIAVPTSLERSGSVSQEEGEMDTESDTSDEPEEYEPPDAVIAEPNDDSSLISSDDDFYEPADAPPTMPPATNSTLVHTVVSTISAHPPVSDSDTPSIALADDLASELQPELEQAYFAPYESALKSFKAYRYHPHYSQDVSGGFRSLTYSHQINAEKPLCKYEAAGGVCNDQQCQDQHFRSMQLSDDKILVQLGTTNPGRTPEEKHQWTEGLKLVLKDLRQLNTRDPDVVATAIANYRRQFLKDPSRVLVL
ncbi:hypothetical protein W97_04848 [Coniosporium apollinis CBS 100218]|uniref:Putative zinc-finger domain-containing protein n=1 Tax=Coniosporium apollinis (strain CBS 100218) TaxID=1168221 RepID=R7YUN3_CONA1|nr:uncharacterized protein W97_04848 [Coniosporium apollinis CBS 100218]EON65610.1 hypothetical protein W97_04848 [Coniosporium apollinis CBS 100218]